MTIDATSDPTDTAPSPAFAAGSGAPVVLLHGLAMSWRAWRPLLPALSDRYAVLAPTLPGHRGGPAHDAAHIESLVGALEDQLDDAGLDTAHLVGNSLGGWLALELARRGRARSVTAVSPAGAWRRIDDQWRVHSLLYYTHLVNRLPLATAMSPSLRSATVRRTTLRALMERGDRVSHADAVEMIRDSHGCTVVPELLRSGRRSRLAALESGSTPIRVVWGRRDRVIPYRRHGHPLRAALPDATEVSLPGAGHVPMWDAPQLLLSLIGDQITTVEGR